MKKVRLLSCIVIYKKTKVGFYNPSLLNFYFIMFIYINFTTTNLSKKFVSILLIATFCLQTLF